MAMQYYEAHITMQSDAIYRDNIRRFVEKNKWKFSAIDGDINFGDGVKCYATRQFKQSRSAEDLIEELKNMAVRCSTLRGVKILRRKIECVIYDDRSSKVMFEGCSEDCATCPSVIS